MRWDRLFDDLEAQLAAHTRLELDAEVAERTRTERSKITLGERIAGGVGARLVVRVRGGSVARGRLDDSGDGWLLLVDDGGRQQLVATAAVLGVSGLGRPRDDTRARRFGIGSAVRGISRDRRAVAVIDVDGGTTHGTIDGVGADAFDITEHPLDSPRRAENVRGERVIPFAAVALISSS
ncbi:hypothetical protein ASG73_08590 [Janibacter sp. Soil728]|uniref:hypothetical protein n=1 Tax=Janibacter sp. Soil728 TaxID=1736393 RepID=UPI0006F824EE|nr:hypothetical protein [Janibacter sp. Soil728]KRE37695.1 hypothetical protein ASG73_08590 [Janibacter sp. Soil728]